jgi:uncharacterized membrane protein YhaH (DUF805 family)
MNEMGSSKFGKDIKWWVLCTPTIPLVIALLVVGVGAVETQRYIAMDHLTAHLNGTNLAFFGLVSLATLCLIMVAATKTTRRASDRETALAWLLAAIGGVVTLVTAESAYQNICLQGSPCLSTPYGPKIPFLFPSLLLICTIGYCFVLFSRSFVLFIMKSSGSHKMNC